MNSPFRKSLRNEKINYRSGWFFVTVQVSRNKSIFGAVVGEGVELNGFGRAVWEYWRGMSAKYPELEVFEAVLMPNHFHALLRIRFRETNRANHLGFLMSRFKGGTAFLYGKARRAGEVEDIGEHLWQRDYWDDLVTSEEEFQAVAKYIRDNPKNWSRDRYGACTRFSFGDLALLDAPRIAFVASQGFFASELRPRKIWASGKGRGKGREEGRGEGREVGRLKPPPSIEKTAGSGAISAAGSGGLAAARGAISKGAGSGDMAARSGAISKGAALAVPETVPGNAPGNGPGNAPENALAPVLISTFTSAQEREALRRALAKGKRVIQVVPQGLPSEGEMASELLAACRAGRALLISPQPPGSRLNKKVATWCNEYALRHADEIWVGDLSPNGMLATMLAALHRTGAAGGAAGA